MKKIAFASLTIFLFTTFISEAYAQCVQCSTQGRKFICAPSTSGGRGCLTNEAGTTCAISQPCGAAAAAQTSWEGIVLEERLVAEVKRADADLARVLDQLRQHTEMLAGGSAKVYLLPEVPGEPGGPAASMEDELYSMAARFDEKERKGPPVKPAAYEVTLDGANNSAFATLKISLLGRNPNAASQGIVVNLTKAEKGGWVVSGWSAKPAN